MPELGRSSVSGDTLHDVCDCVTRPCPYERSKRNLRIGQFPSRSDCERNEVGAVKCEIEMCRHVTAVSILVMLQLVGSAPPMRVTIDCPSDDSDPIFSLNPFSTSASGDKLDLKSFCNLINSAIPKAVEDGHFVLMEEKSADQEVFENTVVPIAVPPPKGFLPKLPKWGSKPPKLKLPKLSVPSLMAQERKLLAPKVGSPILVKLREMEQESSAERLEKFKKGVKKLLHVVKVLGKVDEYISDRTRIVVEKLSKTLVE